MDKYWITFSQWHKSSAAAGFEAACGVVRHFKGSCVAPFEGIVNRGTQRALRKTSLREVTSSFLGPILQRSTSTEPSSQKMRPSVCISVPVHLSSIRLFSRNFLTGFICSHLYLSLHLSLSFCCCFNRLRVSCYLASQSTASYHGQCSLLALQPGRDQSAWVVLCICKQKETTVYSPIYW